MRKNIKGWGQKYRALNTVKLESPGGIKGLARKFQAQEEHFTMRLHKSAVEMLSSVNLAFSALMTNCVQCLPCGKYKIMVIWHNGRPVLFQELHNWEKMFFQYSYWLGSNTLECFYGNVIFLSGKFLTFAYDFDSE